MVVEETGKLSTEVIIYTYNRCRADVWREGMLGKLQCFSNPGIFNVDDAGVAVLARFNHRTMQSSKR